MRLSRSLLLVPFLAAAALLPASRTLADDTKDFLDPANWEGRSDLWKIEGSSVIGETKEDPKYNTFFCSKKKYGDFELTCKILLREGVGNSGIQVRSEVFDKEKFRVKGPQVDVGQGYFGSLYGEGVGGYLLKAKKDAAKPKEYNDYSVVVKGNHITIKVNDEVTVDSDFPDNKGKNPAPAEGIIAFQIHAGYPKMLVEFKDIKFKNLSQSK
jgi:hypothetical protein